MPVKRSDGRLVPNILMVGTGEYTTGYTDLGGSQSDKKRGVVFLVSSDQKRLGNVGKLFMAGTNGTKFPAIRKHLQALIGDVYKDMPMDFASFPADDVPKDGSAYVAAMDSLGPGDGIITFTPDNTHFEIAKEALSRGINVMLTKPPVKTLEHHLQLIDISQRNGLLVDLEVHKRFDPIYSDARDLVRQKGNFTNFWSYMTQPKIQLDTFRAWAGRSSDISYYLNSHHVDWHVWAMEGIARPITVVGMGSTGIAHAKGIDTEDMITLNVIWENMSDPAQKGVATYTAGWVEPTSDGWTQQRFECQMNKVKVQVDQTRRGYVIAEDSLGIRNGNPLYMKYSPTDDGYFDGQRGYGYVSIARFIEAIGQMLNGEKTSADFERSLPTIKRTPQLTAILEAGRRSLDMKSMPIDIKYDDSASKVMPTKLEQAYEVRR